MSGRWVSSGRRRALVSVVLAVVMSLGVPVPVYGSEGGEVEVGPVEDGGVHQPAIDALRRHHPRAVTDLCGQDATNHFRTNDIPAPPEQFQKGRFVP